MYKTVEISKISKTLLIYLGALFVPVLVELLGIQICANVSEFTSRCSHKTFYVDDKLCIFSQLGITVLGSLGFKKIFFSHVH